MLEHRFQRFGLSDMRHAYKFRPEWAYPARSFARTTGIVIVALAVGATAGSAVVFSFVDRPPSHSSVAARSLGVSIQAAPTLPGETPKAQPDPRVVVRSESAKESRTDGSAIDDRAATAGAAPSPVAEKPPVVASADKKVTKKRHVATHYAWHGGPLGPLPGEYHMNAIWGRY